MDLMYEYHNRTDHGRDGAAMDSLTCNCRQLFGRYYDKAYMEGYNAGALSSPIPRCASESCEVCRP